MVCNNTNEDEYGDEYGEESPKKEAPTEQRTLFSSEINRDSERLMSSENSSRYSPEVVANQMLARKDRKIPHSVYKPHAEYVILLHSS